MNINLDQQSLGDCLKTIGNIGSNTHKNICTGESITVPWGAADYMTAVFILFLVAIFAVIFIGLIKMIREV
jgi:hypothetical protein